MFVSIYRLDNPANKHEWFKKTVCITHPADIEVLRGYVGPRIFMHIHDYVPGDTVLMDDVKDMLDIMYETDLSIAVDILMKTIRSVYERK